MASKSLIALLHAVFAVGLNAQPCEPTWSDGFPWTFIQSMSYPGILAEYDSGDGVELYMGGSSGYREDMETWCVQRLASDEWVSTGYNLVGRVYDMAVFDDGDGPELYVGGELWWVPTFTRCTLAKWDGEVWTPLVDSPDFRVYALEVFADESGSALFVGGNFTEIGGRPIRNIAKWDGREWSGLDTGLDLPCKTLRALDMGDGMALFAGGAFRAAGGKPANGIARWDGREWEPLGDGVRNDPYNPVVAALAVHDDGSGLALYAAGWFTEAGGVSVHHIARWDGSRWSSVGRGFAGGILEESTIVYSLEVFDDGIGERLFAAGIFRRTPDSKEYNLPLVACWDGKRWTSPDGGMAGINCRSLLPYDDGTGPALWAAGGFHTAGGRPAVGLAKLALGRWSRVGRGFLGSPSSLALVEHADGPLLYAGGAFRIADEVDASSIASWDGRTWREVGGGLNRTDRLYAVVADLLVVNDCDQPRLIVTGDFDSAGAIAARNIAQWDGAAWSTFGNGLKDMGRELAIFDDGDGDRLYAATRKAGERCELNRWDGVEWTPVGQFVDSYGFPGHVDVLEVFDDGTGPALYVGGEFTTVAGVEAFNLAKWDGLRWMAVGSGIPTGIIFSLRIFDDGSGPALFVGGDLVMTINGRRTYSIVKWDGFDWSAVGHGLTGRNGSFVRDMIVADDGRGPALFVTGAFEMPGPIESLNIARWDGREWSTLGSGIGSLRGVERGLALARYDDVAGPSIFVSGSFSVAGGRESKSMAQWIGCRRTCDADCDQNTGPGVLDAFDFLCFYEHFLAGSSYACDWDTSTGKGVCDTLDIIEFLNALYRGCQ